MGKDFDQSYSEEQTRHALAQFVGFILFAALLYLIAHVSSCAPIEGADTADAAALYRAAHAKAAH